MFFILFHNFHIFILFIYCSLSLSPCGVAAQRGAWPLHSWGFLITHNDAESVGFLWTSDQLVVETSTLQHTTITTHTHTHTHTSMPSVGFEPIISASERPQIYALDRAATGTGVSRVLGQTSGMSSQHQAKKIISYKLTSVSAYPLSFSRYSPLVHLNSSL